MSWLNNIKKIYNDVDGQLGGLLPGGVERTNNPTEQALALASQLPPVQVLRNGMRTAGALNPETFGPLADAGENAIRAITGDRRDRAPSDYTSTTRSKLADAIDKATPDQTMMKDKDGFTQVDYPHYNKDGGAHKGPIAYVGGRVWGRKNKDGSYELRSDENYDFNAGVQRGNQEYKNNLDRATMDALGRGDFVAALSSVPDHLAYHTGAGTEGFNISGKFMRPGQGSSTSLAPKAVSEKTTLVAEAPSAYAVQAGDTLSSIAAQRGSTVAELIKRNNIANPDLISIGQMIR